MRLYFVFKLNDEFENNKLYLSNHHARTLQNLLYVPDVVLNRYKSRIFIGRRYY